MAEQSANLVLPLDICEWVAPATVASWVQEELQTLHVTAGAEGGPKPLLGVLAFAYARGVFDSEEILRLCLSDPHFRLLSQGQTSSPEQLARFRHKERGLLVTVTVRLLTRAALQKLELSGTALPPAVKRRLHENAVDRLDNARHMDRGEEL